ncbi:unnamed protein product [Mytilus edulis]|uniref:Uncharacterized protein n=1 Tax=Mytilus edulis TaxID=6550 RepID=A0A8S3PQ42_MYTED|nr:unnamed protein product [Mytilus edulis]
MVKYLRKIYQHNTNQYVDRFILHVTLELSFEILGLPIEIQKLDKKSAEVFTSLLGEESYPHFESRVMLAGEQGTGKTTIARYLVGKRPTRFRMSTDGIELYNGLSYMDIERRNGLVESKIFPWKKSPLADPFYEKSKDKKNIKFPRYTVNQSRLIRYKDEPTLASEEYITYKPNESPSSGLFNN